MIRPPPISTLVPYTTLFRSLRDVRRYELPKIDHGCDGFPVNVICRVPGMPDRVTVRRWERHNPECRRLTSKLQPTVTRSFRPPLYKNIHTTTPNPLLVSRNH